jgi:uncharacterized membrane protein YbhN (UPF0104 family)
LKTVLKLSVSGALLYIVLRKTDLSAIRQLLEKSNYWLLAAALLFFIASKVLSSFRLNIFLKVSGINITSADNLRLYLLGMFYNLFLPGGIGGDAYKAYFLRKYLEAPLKRTVTALLFDRISGLLALFALCFIFFIFISNPLVNIFLITVACGLVIVVFYFIIYRWFELYYSVINKTNLQSVFVQMLQVMSALLIFQAFGNKGQAMPYMFVFLLSSAVAVIPFTIGGIGARELTFMYASDILGMDLSVSIALSLMFFAITAAVSLSGIWYVIKPIKITGSLQ